MKQVAIATKNPGKLREMAERLGHLPLEALPLSAFGELPDAVEDGTTFEENARIKALFFMKRTGCACIADDSGLEVEALGGMPGVHSARFAGIHGDDRKNNEKLLEELRRVGAKESPACYRCSLVFVDTGGQELHAEGRCNGVVRMEARGTGGFGYDPYFYLADGRSMAELGLAEKDSISHRGAALRRLVQQLEAYLI